MVPECDVHFPPEARAQAQRIADTFARRRARAEEWLGVSVKGRARVHLVRDYEEMVQAAGAGAPEWAVAVARRDDLLAFRLDIVDRTPAQSLDLVLKHEVVHHVLNHLGSGPPLRALPRWFEEGLCVNHAGVAYFEPETSLERMAAAGRLPSFADADALFREGPRGAAIGYEYGERAVRAFLRRFGERRLRELLARFGEGAPFANAFADATGVPLSRFEEEWRASVTPAVPLWLFVVLENFELALLCFGAVLVFCGWVAWRLRRRRALAALGE